MEKMPYARATINAPENMALICNACNMEMTAEKQIDIRRWKCKVIGQDECMKGGILPGPLAEETLMVIGCMAVQRWLDNMNMKGDYNAWQMAKMTEWLRTTRNTG